VGQPVEARRQDAFATFVLPEVEVLLRVARSLTGHDADAEDLVQDTLLRAYRAIDRFDGRHPRAWLLTILRNTHINRLRRRRPEVLSDGEALDRAAPSGESTEEQVLAATFDAAVEVAFRTLPERFRRAVELVDLDGLSYQEAASVLAVPVGTIMSRLHRGRTRIRAQLEADGRGSRRTGT
jgi:RNA polymerase sigma-70 factor (ECF subfamily)